MRFKTYNHRAKRAGGRPEPDVIIEGARNVRGPHPTRGMHHRDEHGRPTIWRGRIIPAMTWIHLLCVRRHPMKCRPEKRSRRRPMLQPFDFRVGISSNNDPF